MTAAKAEELYFIEITDAPLPLRGEVMDAAPSAMAPDPPIEPGDPIPPTPPAPQPPAPSPPPPQPPTAAEIEANADRKRRAQVAATAAKRRGKNIPSRRRSPARP